MKTKIISFCIVILASTSTFAQSLWFEQDVRILDKKPALFYTQIQYTQNIGKAGFSIAPYISTSYDWHEGLAFLNYTKGIFAGGMGAGLESNKTFSQLGFRWSPWISLTPTIASMENATLEVLSQWEFGTEKKNYWYSNSLLLKSNSQTNLNGEFGILCRRFYGIGPIMGISLGPSKSTIKISISPLYDLETHDKIVLCVCTVNIGV